MPRAVPSLLGLRARDGEGCRERESCGRRGEGLLLHTGNGREAAREEGGKRGGGGPTRRRPPPAVPVRPASAALPACRAPPRPRLPPCLPAWPSRMEGGGCGCRGVRSCLLCEVAAAPPAQRKANFVYCPRTGLAVGEKQSEFAGWAFPFPGVFLIADFVSAEEEKEMVELMDGDAWKPSQSGRRKQDYGPKVNFKKRKLRVGPFTGLPSFSQEVVARMREHALLRDFSPVEQCNLEYSPERGSGIDPHWDDGWLWGERLVSLNLLSATVLSMTCDAEDPLWLFPAGPLGESLAVAVQDGPPSREALGGTPDGEGGFSSHLRSVPSREATVAIPLPRRSLVVLYGPARYRWKHAIHRNHITSRRICVTFRELSAEFSPGGQQGDVGEHLLGLALTFQGTPV
uniref:AlkB homolog 4, lysine demethylase n=1 Tax=Salvator merianae TaxID=96440 RepID=A0A8D0BNV5_SALMN